MRGDGSIYLRGEIWWMKFYRDGRSVSMSCKTESRDLAKRKLQAEMRKRDDELLEPRYKRVTIGDLYKNMLAWFEANNKPLAVRDAQQYWKYHLQAVFENVKAAQFGSAAQHAYRAARLKENAAPASINRELQMVRRAFRLGAENEPPLVRKVPKFHITKEDNARKFFLNRTQMEALKLAAAKHSLGMRAIIEAAHMLGWRRSELLGLRIANVHLDSKTIRLERSKNGEAREVPLTSTLLTYVEALAAGKQPNDLLFGMTYHAFQDDWEKVREAAGLPNVLFHDLRRTSARSKRAAGVDTSITMSLMGWKTDAMFRRYGIVSTEDKATALAKQEAFEAGGTA